MHVVPVPVRKDNYAYFLIDKRSNEAVVVDPYDIPKIKTEAERLNVHIVANLTTHHHHDHSGGNEVCVSFFVYTTPPGF
jgi:hydroxyacylglutathione hydrolase